MGPVSELLVERESEVARIEALIGAAAAGRGQVAVIEGPAGIGKTRLVGAARDLAERRGVACLVASGFELQRDYPFGVVRRLFEPWVRMASAAQRRRMFVGAAGFVESLLVGGEDMVGHAVAGDPGFRLLHGSYWLVANLSDKKPMLLVIDDAHWADPESLRFAQFLATRVRELPAALVLTTRPSEGDAPMVGRLVGEVGAELIRPEALSPDSVASIVSVRLGSPAEGTFASACHELTGGNPFYVNELVAQLAADQVAPTDANVGRLSGVEPRTVAGAIMTRLARLGDDVTELARVAAVLGDRAELRHAATLSGLGPEAAARAADVLVEAGLFQPAARLSFVHPIVRAAVYEDLGVHRRALLHAAAARVLAEEDTGPSVVALHLLQSEPTGDAAMAGVLRSAGLAAAAEGAPATAVRLLRRALAEAPLPAGRAELLLELGQVEINAGQLDAARGHLEEAARLAERTDQQALVAREMARVKLTQALFAEAVEDLQRAAEGVAGVDRELALELEAEVTTIGALSPAAASNARERALARGRGLSADSRGECLVLANAAYWMALTGSPQGAVGEVAERALSGGRLLDDGGADRLPLYNAIGALTLAERFDLAERTLEAAIDDARRRGSLFGFVLASTIHAHLDLRRGDLAGAEANARAAVEAGTGGFLMADAYLLVALSERGHLDEAAAVCEALGVGVEPPEGHLFTIVLGARGGLRLAQGRAAEAVTDLRLAYERRERWAGTAAAHATATDQTLLAQALFRAGEVDQARAQAEADLTVAEGWGGRREVGRATRVLGEIEGGEQGLERLHQSVQVLRETECALDLAYAWVALGAALRRGNRRAAAREPLRHGLDLAARCGADALVNRAREELQATGARPRRELRSGVESLTASERRVAEMAAEGMSNPEIAQALFVTRATIETQLSAAYRKLDIPGRKGLKAALQNFMEAP